MLIISVQTIKTIDETEMQTTTTTTKKKQRHEETRRTKALVEG